MTDNLYKKKKVSWVTPAREKEASSPIDNLRANQSAQNEESHISCAICGKQDSNCWIKEPLSPDFLCSDCHSAGKSDKLEEIVPNDLDVPKLPMSKLLEYHDFNLRHAALQCAINNYERVACNPERLIQDAALFEEYFKNGCKNGD